MAASCGNCCDRRCLPAAQQPIGRAAAASAVLQRLCVISGGPGTGKTTTVVKLLAARRSKCTTVNCDPLAAPTGKAAPA